MKRYEKYKAVDLHWLKEVPSHWGTEPLKSIFCDRKELNKNLIITNILSVMKGIGVIPYAEKGNVGNKASEDISNYKIVKKNDIVLNSMNVIIGSVGKSEYEGVLSKVYYVLKNKDNKLNNTNYFSYIFKIEKFYKHLRIYGRGILEHRLKIPMNSLNLTLLPIPPLQEQIQIANFLDWKINEIDKLIELEKEKINKTKVIKNKIIDRFLELEKQKSTKLKFIGTFAKGNGIARENLDKEAEYPVILYGDIYTKYNFSFSKVENKIKLDVYNLSTKISKNTLLFTTSGETKEDIGKTVIYKGKDNVAIGGDILSFVVNNRGIDPTYLMYFLNSTKCLEYKYIFSRGDIIVHISEHKLKEIEISYPIIEIQRKIVRLIDKHLSDVENLISKTNNQITYLEELKQSLISDVVTGKIDVRGVEIPKKYKMGK